MDKAILIIDMPKGCYECKIRFDDEYSNWCSYDNPEPNGVYPYIEKKTKPNWCPLKPLPNKYNTEAEWVYDHWCEFKCSNCGNWSNSKPYKGMEKYCPECGAKMNNYYFTKR